MDKLTIEQQFSITTMMTTFGRASDEQKAKLFKDLLVYKYALINYTKQQFTGEL